MAKNPQIIVTGKLPDNSKNVGIIKLHLGQLGLVSFFFFSFILSMAFFFIGVNLGSSGTYQLWADSSLNCIENSDSTISNQAGCLLKKTLLAVDSSGNSSLRLSDFKAYMEDNTVTIDHLYSVFSDLNIKQQNITQLREQVADCQSTSAESLLYLKSILEISQQNCSAKSTPSNSNQR